MLEFETYYPDRLGDDRAVLHHELGHALAWYRYGGAIGRLCLRRTSEGFLEASVRFRGRNEEMPAHAFIESVAVRRLAGEVAARAFLQLPTNRVSLDFPLSPSFSKDAVHYLIQDVRMDVEAVLLSAIEVEGHGWFKWLAKRHETACQIIENGSKVIENGARSLEHFVPKVLDTERLIPGLHLIELFERGAIDTAARPPMEIVHNRAKGNICTRLRRTWRSFFRKSLLIGTDPD